MSRGWKEPKDIHSIGSFSLCCESDNCSSIETDSVNKQQNILVLVDCYLEISSSKFYPVKCFCARNILRQEWKEPL